MPGMSSGSTGPLAGNYFGAAYTNVTDPQCAATAASSGIRLHTPGRGKFLGQIVLQNPKPGTRGNLGQNVIENPGTWLLSTSMSKAFKIRESKTLRFRVDGTNILNHPTPAAPTLNINGGTMPFGNIASKTGNRQIQGLLRLEF